MICSKICFIASFLGKKIKSQLVIASCPKSSEKSSGGKKKMWFTFRLKVYVSIKLIPYRHAFLLVAAWSPVAFLMIQWMLAIWTLVPLPFLNPT